MRTLVPLSAGCRQGTARDEAREPAGTRQGIDTHLVGAGPLQEVLEWNYIIGVGLKEVVSMVSLGYG